MTTLIKHKKFIIISLISIVIMAIISLLLYCPLENFLNDPTALKQQLDKLGNWGKLFLVLTMSLQIVLVFLPGEIIEVASGFCYGTFEGMFICLLGSVIGTIIIYSIVNKYGIKLVDKFFDSNQINEITFLKKEKHLEVIIFIIFFIPGTPKDILTYLAPFTKIPMSSFILITTIARIPSVITSTIGGNALSNQDYHFTLLVFIITAIISIIGLLCYKKYLAKKNL